MWHIHTTSCFYSGTNWMGWNMWHETTQVCQKNVINAKAKINRFLMMYDFWELCVCLFPMGTQKSTFLWWWWEMAGRRFLWWQYSVSDWFAQVNAFVRTHHVAYLRFMGFNICDFFLPQTKRIFDKYWLPVILMSQVKPADLRLTLICMKTIIWIDGLNGRWVDE